MMTQELSRSSDSSRTNSREILEVVMHKKGDEDRHHHHHHHHHSNNSNHAHPHAHSHSHSHAQHLQQLQQPLLPQLHQQHPLQQLHQHRSADSSGRLSAMLVRTTHLHNHLGELSRGPSSFSRKSLSRQSLDSDSHASDVCSPVATEHHNLNLNHNHNHNHHHNHHQQPQQPQQHQHQQQHRQEEEHCAATACLCGGSGGDGGGGGGGVGSFLNSLSLLSAASLALSAMSLLLLAVLAHEHANAQDHPVVGTKSARTPGRGRGGGGGAEVPISIAKGANALNSGAGVPISMRTEKAGAGVPSNIRSNSRGAAGGELNNGAGVPGGVRTEQNGGGESMQADGLHSTDNTIQEETSYTYIKTTQDGSPPRIRRDADIRHSKIPKLQSDETKFTHITTFVSDDNQELADFTLQGQSAAEKGEEDEEEETLTPNGGRDSSRSRSRSRRGVPSLVEAAVAMATLVLTADLSCLMVCCMQSYFASKLLSLHQGHDRSAKYLRECSSSRFISVMGFFLSIPAFIIALVLVIVIKLHPGPALTSAVMLGVGGLFCVLSVLQNLYHWRAEKARADEGELAWERQALLRPPRPPPLLPASPFRGHPSSTEHSQHNQQQHHQRSVPTNNAMPSSPAQGEMMTASQKDELSTLV